MLIAKISFYFESAKKTGEKFREKLGFQNHCPHPYHPPNRYQDPCRFPVKCGGYVCWATYTPAQLRS